GAILKARELLAADPELYYYADQYSNPANWQAHYQTTAPEIWTQTDGTVTHFVAGLGTSGTLVGTARRLREYNPDMRVVSLQPDAPFHGVEGWKHMPSAIIPKIYDATLADEDFGVSTEASHTMVRRLAREEGYLVGISAGAAMVGALQVAEGLAARGEPGVVVTLFPDNAYKYLSAPFWTK
ncbi:MAG: pyridoxal-phosphate dependent enzyme, partial [Armatimonadetes bacterium]|nr:pyridoxal-phosphate dependent enzyme [Anaerolineae bacterium]